MKNTSDLTEATENLFKALWNDKDNWSGMPLFDGTKEERGNLTHLKRAGLVTTMVDDGCTFVIFTKAGEEFGNVIDSRTFPTAQYHATKADVTGRVHGAGGRFVAKK